MPENELDPVALADSADIADEAAALPSPYDENTTVQEDGSDTSDADPGVDDDLEEA